VSDEALGLGGAKLALVIVVAEKGLLDTLMVPRELHLHREPASPMSVCSP
jgi:hypothetical protein